MLKQTTRIQSRAAAVVGFVCEQLVFFHSFQGMEALEASQRAFLLDLQAVLHRGRRHARIRAVGTEASRSRSTSPRRSPSPTTTSLTTRVRVVECDVASALHRLERLCLGATALMHTLHQEPDYSSPFGAITDWIGHVRQELSALQVHVRELQQRAEASEARLAALEGHVDVLRLAALRPDCP